MPTNWSRMSFLERMKFVTDHAEEIYVRIEIDGRWKNVRLSEVPHRQIIVAKRKLAASDTEPVRVIGG